MLILGLSFQSDLDHYQLGRQLAQTQKRAPNAYDQLNFEYDKCGLLTKETNNAGDFTHAYDKLGNLIETKLPDGRFIRNLYYGSGHLLQTNLENGEQKHILAEFERDHLTPCAVLSKLKRII